MSEPELPDAPLPESKVEARGFGVMLRFHPEVRMEKKKGHSFAASLSEYVSIEKDELQSHKWVFTEPLPGEAESRLLIVVTPSSIQLDVRFPEVKQEWIEHRFEWILECFRKQFTPKVILYCEAIFRGELKVFGDARTFLAVHVMQMDPDRIDPFRRPVHLIGLRFFFPPFSLEPEDGGENSSPVDWAVDVRAESLMEDPGKLFLEAEAEWFETESWDKQRTSTIVGRLVTVREYLEKNVVGFLRHSSNGENDNTTGEGN